MYREPLSSHSRYQLSKINIGISPWSTKLLALNGTLSLTTDTSSGNVRTCVVSPCSTSPLTLLNGTWKLEHTHCLYWSLNSPKRRWTHDREWTNSQRGLPGLNIDLCMVRILLQLGHPLWWCSFVLWIIGYNAQHIGHPQSRPVLIANQHCCHKAHSCS